MFAGVVIIFRNFGLLIKCENKIIIVLCLCTIIGDMNRVLSFPQSHTCDSPSEAVSKRFCFSCIFSVSFLSLILGYLLGSRKHGHGLVNTKCALNEGPLNLNVDIKYIDILKSFEPVDKDSNTSGKKTNYTNYEEAVRLKQHFETHKFDEVSQIIASNILLTFKNKNIPDALEIIIVDKGETHYRNVRNATYSYTIPHDAQEIRTVSNNVSGLPVYANFGSHDDFNFLLEKGISLRGCIVLLRLGKISIREKVTTALKRGATGVLLFADPQQYPNVDVLSTNEEISPTLLADLQKIYNSPGHSNFHDGVPVQIIEAMTAQKILGGMIVTNKSPDSWRGSLTAFYSIGPGFLYENWRLVLYSYFLNVNYTAYDVVAYLRGNQEQHDRYIILGNARKNLNNYEKTSESTNITTLMAVSKTFAELKTNKGWKPCRTVVFCSFDLKEAEVYSEDSWLQKYKNIIEARAVVYLDIKQPIQGLEYLSVKVNPLLQNLFENISSLVENPNAEEKLTGKKSLFDVWNHQQKALPNNSRKENSNVNVTPADDDSELEMMGNELFDSFEIPTLALGYNTKEKQSSKNTENMNIYEHENAIVKFWTLLIFSLANDLIIPFNVSAYPTILNHFYEKLYLENEKHLQNMNLADDFKHFGESLKNLSTKLKNFQNDIENLNLLHKPFQSKILNDKFLQINRLIKCDDSSVDMYFPKKSQDQVFISLQDSFSASSLDENNLKISLKKAINCVNEIDYLINE